jgi:hypothetical protein
MGKNDLGSRRRELSGHIKVCAFVMFTLYPLAALRHIVEQTAAEGISSVGLIARA